MKEVVKVSQRTCLSCKYHMAIGTQPGRLQKAKGTMPNVGCNYLSITGHSRIFEKGEKAYPSEYCDKYEPGDKLTDFGEFQIGNVEHDEFERYKMDRIFKERGIQI